MMFANALPWLLMFSGVLISLMSWQKIRRQSFFQDTPWLFPWGVYVWGDGLVLGLFWLVAGLIGLVVSLTWLWRLALVFFILRSFFEVIYWLNHQAQQKTFIPPWWRKSKLNSEEVAIIYQLFHTSLAAIFILGLVWSWAV